MNPYRKNLFRFCLVIFVLSSLILRVFAQLDLTVAVEMILILALFFFVATRRLLEAMICQASRPVVMCVIGLLFCLLIGQFTPIPRTMFPFTPWIMFARTRNDDQARMRLIYGRLPNGERVRLDVAALYPSLSACRAQCTIDHKLDKYLQARGRDDEPIPAVAQRKSPGIQAVKTLIHRFLKVKYDDPPTLAERQNSLDDYLKPFGYKYNRLHPSNPIVQLEIDEVTIYRKERQFTRHDPVMPIYSVVINVSP